jgi:YVTN family beta-propeller protein
MGKKSMASFETKTGKIQYFPLSGAAVQTAVTPDGQYAFATVYGTKKIAWINVNTNEQGYINLPDDAKGPIQLYPTPDSQYLYVADQGYYFEQSTGNEVYKVKISEKAVEQSIEVGLAPHGVVVDKAGTFVYVTNLLSEDVSIIDTSTNKEVARIPVGKMPNGISIWNKKEGGTP